MRFETFLYILITFPKVCLEESLGIRGSGITPKITFRNYMFSRIARKFSLNNSAVRIESTLSGPF